MSLLNDLMSTPIAAITLYSTCILLMIIGLYTMMISHHLIRMILGLSLLENGVNLAFIIAGYKIDGVPPVITDIEHIPAIMVDPIPQAMVLTAIVIGVAIQAFALILVIHIYKAYGTLDRRELKLILQAQKAYG